MSESKIKIMESTEEIPTNPLAEQTSVFSAIQEDEILRLMLYCTFTMTFKGRFHVQSMQILANSLDHARERAKEFCIANKLRYINVSYSFLDLDKPFKDKHDQTQNQF